MDVADAVHVFLRHTNRITATKQAMAGVEQQTRLGARVFHQEIDLFLALDDGSHVVVIDECNALLRCMGSKRLYARAEGSPVAFLQPRPVNERLVIVTVDGVGGLANNDDFRPHGFEQVERRLHSLLLGLDIICQKIE